MVEKDFSKCQCPKAGWCDLLQKEMTATPPNWQWCQGLTEEERKRYHKKVNGEVRTIRKAIKAGWVDTVNFVDDIPEPTNDYAVCVIPANDSAMELLDITRDSIKSYAKRCGADYIELTGDQHPNWPMANKYRLHKVASTYKKTLYLDCDVAVKDDAPNIFTSTPDDKISIYDEFESWEEVEDTNWIRKEQELIVHKLLGKSSKLLSNGKFEAKSMFNAGVMVIPKDLADYYNQPSENYPRVWCFDQHYLTLTLPKEKLNNLSREWNNSSCVSTKKKEIRVSEKFWSELESCHFIHVNGLNSNESDRHLRKSMLIRYCEGDYSDGKSQPKARFVKTSDLIYDSLAMIHKIPPIRGVVGVPRSGMLPASTIAVALSVPLYSFENNRLVKLNAQEGNGGSRMHGYEEKLDLPLLVVDDTAYSGGSLHKTRQILLKNYPEINFLYTVIYHEPCVSFLTKEESRDHGFFIDIINNELKFPHILEWNIFNAHPTQLGMFDLDGVFCPDCTPEQDGNENLYVEWMNTVEPIIERIPRIFDPMAICTARPEKYREETERWLEKHGIGYGKLFMWESTKEERDKGGFHRENVAHYKAETFKSFSGPVSIIHTHAMKRYTSKPKFFIESCDFQSRLIAENLHSKDSWVISINEKRVY